MENEGKTNSSDNFTLSEQSGSNQNSQQPQPADSSWPTSPIKQSDFINKSEIQNHDGKDQDIY